MCIITLKAGKNRHTCRNGRLPKARGKAALEPSATHSLLRPRRSESRPQTPLSRARCQAAQRVSAFLSWSENYRQIRPPFSRQMWRRAAAGRAAERPGRKPTQARPGQARAQRRARAAGGGNAARSRRQVPSARSQGEGGAQPPPGGLCLQPGRGRSAAAAR